MSAYTSASRICVRAFSSSSHHHKVPHTKLYINGKFVDSKASKWIDLHNPATNEVSSCFEILLISILNLGMTKINFSFFF